MLSVLWRFRWYPFTVNTPLEGRFQENISVEELRGVQDRFVGSSAIKTMFLNSLIYKLPIIHVLEYLKQISLTILYINL